jgi:hypothetical protein
MPFTFAHPAIVIPLTKLKWFSATALILGSMAPDFEYFIRMRIYGSFSHSLAGVFLFDFPLVLFLAFIYHNWVRDELLINLPVFLRKHLIVYKNFNWNIYFRQNVLGVAISALIGIASHILWDAFTHPNGFFVENISVLRGSFVLGGIRFKVFNTLQHASTVVGLAAMVYWVLKMHPVQAVKKRNITKYWLWAGSICLVITAIRFFTGLQLSEYKHLIVTVIPAAMLGIWAASVITKNRTEENYNN